MVLLARLLLLLLSSLGVLDAEAAKNEDAVGVLGSSVLLDPKVKVDLNKNEIIWTFISSHTSPLTILHHIPDYIQWAKPSEQFKSRLQFIPSNGSLIVNGLEADDQGDYSFMVDEQEMKVIHLVLFEKLSGALILTNSSSLGSTIQLTCNVSGDPHEYRWLKDGGKISWHHQLIDGNRTLVIPEASGRDCGTYTCVAVNPVSSVQANHTLTIPSFPLEDIAIVLLSIVDLVISSMPPVVCVSLQCWKTKSDKAVKRHKCWERPLNICGIVSLAAIFIALISWMGVNGADHFVVAGCCVVSFQLLALVLLFSSQKLDCSLIVSFQKRTDIWNWAALGLNVIAIIISIVFLVFAIQQNNPDCDSDHITWGVFFATRIGSAVIFLLCFVVHYRRKKDASGNTDTEKQEQHNGELETSNLHTRSHS